MQTSLDIGYSYAKDDARNPVQVAINEMARKIASDLFPAMERFAADVMA